MNSWLVLGHKKICALHARRPESDYIYRSAVCLVFLALNMTQHQLDMFSSSSDSDQQGSRHPKGEKADNVTQASTFSHLSIYDRRLIPSSKMEEYLTRLEAVRARLNNPDCESVRPAANLLNIRY